MHVITFHFSYSFPKKENLSLIWCYKYMQSIRYDLETEQQQTHKQIWYLQGSPSVIPLSPYCDGEGSNREMAKFLFLALCKAGSESQWSPLTVPSIGQQRVRPDRLHRVGEGLLVHALFPSVSLYFLLSFSSALHLPGSGWCLPTKGHY